MATQKIAITLPATTLRHVDRWAKKLKKSRSRLIAEQMEERLRQLEEAEVTRLYDETYQQVQARTENRELAEELLGLSPEAQSGEKW
ncbi:MAG: hypothetical protein FJY95_10510 [Candidatus Handelsmanbacteria bacterium]|nr:hypothetical protein [Candidatus Handelsmanbacteria bacterium]